MSSEHDHGATGVPRGRLLAAAAFNSGFAVVQVVVGLAIGSVVVLADAAHQVVDALGLITALGALLLAARPKSETMSFGWGKTDALGALLSALLLLGSIVWITYEAVERLFDPVEVEGGGVILIGLIAIAVNGISVLALDGHSHDHGPGDHGHQSDDSNLALKAARLHLLIDLAGSALVVLAGLLLTGTSWTWIDPVASIILSFTVLQATVQVLKTSIAVLLDRVPSQLSVSDVERNLRSQPGVLDVHHIHVRPLGQARASVTAHVVVEGSPSLHDAQARSHQLAQVLEHDLSVSHSTLQIECHPCEDPNC